MDEAWQKWGQTVEDRLASMDKRVKRGERFARDVMADGPEFVVNKASGESGEDRFVGEVAEELSRKNIKNAILTLAGEVVALRRRVKELESRPAALSYQGVWSAATEYNKGAAVTHDGSIFIATIQSKGVRPGDGNSWVLAVKRGKDARPDMDRVRELVNEAIWEQGRGGVRKQEVVRQ
jgi:hypothetical protein